MSDEEKGRKLAALLAEAEIIDSRTFEGYEHQLGGLVFVRRLTGDEILLVEEHLEKIYGIGAHVPKSP